MLIFSVIVFNFGIIYKAENIFGGETYIGDTYVTAGCYHTLSVVTDKSISDPSFIVRDVFESEAGSFAFLGMGYNIRQYYSTPNMVKANPGKYELQLVSRHAGISVNDYDDKVIAVLLAYFNEKPKFYLALNRNCNTATSSIIRRSGGYVSPSKAMWRLPGWKKW